jgi:hypothetical protein
LSPGASTTTIASSTIERFSAAIVCASSGTPAIGAYCFGSPPPKRTLLPAATISA